jgi:drug/metabolite transporter (DMT)-like permease
VPLAIVFAVLAAVLFGSASPLSKLILKSLSPFQLAGLLYLGAALGVAPGSILRKKLTPVRRIPGKSRRLLAGAILCGGVLGPLALLFGLRIGQASSVSLWLNLELVFTALLGRLLFRDHLTRTGWVAFGGIFAASVMLTGGGGRAAVDSALLVALACLLWGFDNHFTALIDGITPSESTFWKGLVAGSVNLGLGLALGPYLASWRTTVAALLVGVFCYGISMALYITAAQTLGATRGQMFFAAAPFFGMGLSVLLLGERPRPAQLLAALAFVVSLAILFAGRHAHRHVHRATTHEHRHRHDDGHHAHAHAGPEPGEGHVHSHDHAEAEHAHPHLPDIHHRHGHED